MRLLNYLKQIRIFRSIIYGVVGLFTYPGIALFNQLNIEGTEHLEGLPKRNVLFVSNHQTYFADVITFVHIFCAVKWRKFNRLGIPYYLLNPFTNVYFIAAEETMNDNWISKLFKLGGALTVKRTWRAEGKDVERQRDVVDTQKIDKALSHSWVITFPQGTTKPLRRAEKALHILLRTIIPL
jgi:1-acyl-sn-glycerol-3-phosphate acyltransferase